MHFDWHLLTDLNSMDAWPIRFALIVLGYGSVLLPAYFIIKWVEKRDKSTAAHHPEAKSCLWRLLRRFAVGRPELSGSSLVPTAESKPPKPRSFAEYVCQLTALFVGIQVTLVSMGFFQERIMTQAYARRENDAAGPKLDRFGDAQFLVLANRLVALAFAAAFLYWNRKTQPPHAPPLYMYAFCSISNTLSSWCQYEALKYVSFPTQTFCKASKLVPTMLMGRALRRERYSKPECATAALLLLGAALFFHSALVTTARGDARAADPAAAPLATTALSGALLMLGYLAFDAFTPNWQKRLFEVKPSISRYQMMLGVNAFSAALCLVSLVEQGTLWRSARFLCTHERVAADVLLLSASGALAQFCIYAIVQRFGPAALALIMTVRQFVSILLSAAYFGHAVGPAAALGLAVSFVAICLNIYYNFRRRAASH